MRNLDELVDDGNLGEMGATNWLHIPLPELADALDMLPAQGLNTFLADHFQYYKKTILVKI